MMLPSTKIEQLGPRLARILAASEAVRLGESAVISKRVHMVSVNRPQEVRVLSADAGQAFYGRQIRDTIFHLDVFHQVGIVDHRSLARALIDELKKQVPSAVGLLDRMDIQTATGGGRVSGNLTYGRKQSVRRAHANHVHMAMELLPAELPLLVLLALVLEKGIIKQGLEIRKVEKVVLDLHGDNKSKLDLSAYAAESDSQLRQRDSEHKGGDLEPKTGSNNNEAQALEAAHQVSAQTLPPAELLHLLRSCPLEPNEKLRQRWGELDGILDTLRTNGYLIKRRRHWALTDKGKNLLNLVQLHLPELESKLRRHLRRLPTQGGSIKGLPFAHRRPGRLRLRKAPGASANSKDGQLNLAATAASAACRWILGESQPGCIHYRCWRYSRRLRYRGANIVLVLDTSASMSGERLRAARFLAQHLVLSGKDKVAVIIFQGESVLVPDRFSNSWSEIQKQLLSFKAFGLTPLARALQETRAFVQHQRAQKPLVVLITDGIPTVPLTGGDPSADALKVAASFKSAPAEFVCIGLDPNQSFLEKLNKESGGRLHVIKELEMTVLAQLIKKELQRHDAT